MRKPSFSKNETEIPVLTWKGKNEYHQITKIKNARLNIHEINDPSQIIKQALKPGMQQTLFGFIDKQKTRPKQNETIHFYKHEKWNNRLITGDSSVVMNALYNENYITGKIQVVYFDPPYGINFNGNIQMNIFNTESEKRSVDASFQQEQRMAFADTWEHGIHSYLSEMQKQMIQAHGLLAETGSIFVQISIDNLHYMKILLDEIFGKNNFMWEILFRTSSGNGIGDRPTPYNYILWYAKNKDVLKKSGKLHRLYIDRDSDLEKYTNIQTKNGTILPRPKGKLPSGSRLCKFDTLISQRPSVTRSKPHTFPNNKTIKVLPGRQWRLGGEDLDKLYHQNRLYFSKNNVRLIQYPEDYPKTMINVWDGMSISNRTYVVQTSEKVIERCILMSSDPGDLVMDITCGSGITPFVAEKHGRRWICIDNSHLAIAITRFLLQTKHFHFSNYMTKNLE